MVWRGQPRAGRGATFRILAALSALAASMSAFAELESPDMHPALHRISIPVSDVDRSLTLYSGVLDLRVADVIEHKPGRLDEAEHADPEAESRREALLVAGSTPEQSISLLETGRGAADSSGPPVTLWLEVYHYATVVAEAEALGLDVSAERQLQNLEFQPVRERRITDWDGNVIVVYRLESAELAGGECVSYGETGRWEAFDDRQVFVQGSESAEAYLVTTRSRCRNILQEARQVEVARRDGSLCADGARLSFRSGSLGYNCVIERIEAVPNCTEALRRARERRPDWRPFRNTPEYLCVWEAEAEGGEAEAGME